MIVLSVKNLSLSFGANDIFWDVCFDLKKGERLGFIGSNGSGKTSMLKIISGLLDKSSGTVEKSGSATINYLSQLSDYTSGLSVWQDVMSVYDDVFEAEERLRETEQQMASHPESLDKLSKQYETLMRKFEEMGGYSAERMARSVLSGLGVDGSMYNRVVSTLVGGPESKGTACDGSFAFTGHPSFGRTHKPS